MMHIRRLGQKGVTFVELLLVMGLLSIFLVVLTTIFTSTLDVQNQTDAFSSTVSDGRFIMSRLNYDIARATSITTPASLGGSGSTLVMQVNAVTLTYALVGNNFQLTVGANSANINSSGTTVSNLTFQRLGNTGGKDTIRYSFKVTSTALHSGAADTQTFTTTAERR